MKKLIRTLCLVLVVSMLLCIPAAALSVSIPDDRINKYLEESGKLGDDVYYSYDKDAGTVRVYGSGPMWHFTDDAPRALPEDDPLYGFFKITPFCYSNLNKVVIEDGVTTIGEELFCLSRITQVYVAASVKAVEGLALSSEIKSIYFFGDAPAATDCYGKPGKVDLSTETTAYRLLDAKGWDEFKFMTYIDHKYVPAEAQTFCGAPYCDVAGDAWCAKAVLRMWDEGIMNGTAIDVFSPNASLTRGMIAAILYRMADEPDFSGKAGSAVFSDVKKDSFCDTAIGWAYANGIIEGYTDGSFKPNRALNRQELAALLYRYDAKSSPATTTDAQSESGDALNAADAADWDTVSEFAKAPLTWAVKEGVINGTDSSKLVLDPFGTATRAQIAVILDRYLSLG